MAAGDAAVATGRFAPSPTGPLHFGSLVAAVCSYLQARRRHGRWLVRIEDLDPPRESPGAASAILSTLEQLGFEWDGPVLRQSERLSIYREALEGLVRAGHAYPCSCTRAEVRAASLSTPGSTPVYPGTCRNGVSHPRRATAIRLRVTDQPVSFVDGLQGRLTQVLAREVGDFVLRRRDGLFSYQLAVVVDDALQGVTEVVRGTDLLDSTPRQIYLQTLLGYVHPGYLHLPIAVDPHGAKLSKQTGAAAVDATRPGPVLYAVLKFLRQRPPPELANAGREHVWAWAVENWDADPLRGLSSLPAPEACTGQHPA